MSSEEKKAIGEMGLDGLIDEHSERCWGLHTAQSGQTLHYAARCFDVEEEIRSRFAAQESRIAELEAERDALRVRVATVETERNVYRHALRLISALQTRTPRVGVSPGAERVLGILDEAYAFADEALAHAPDPGRGERQLASALRLAMSATETALTLMQSACAMVDEGRWSEELDAAAYNIEYAGERLRDVADEVEAEERAALPGEAPELDPTGGHHE